ncbi:hypothetical protein [Mucilaginibacter sp. dw_454]|uniref:hypothetical protein n=1 Tax=Mucilaginibacter sp. dw_454 TaxID=2720079 RepID=UPI001BD22F45|nr:hypothetical protein [Mucilaginibacter sp. dw_454]
MDVTEFNKFLGSIQSGIKPNTSGVKLTKEQYIIVSKYLKSAFHLNWTDWEIRFLSKCLEDSFVTTTG